MTTTDVILSILLAANIALTIHARLILRGLIRHYGTQIQTINEVHDSLRHRIHRLETKGQK